MDSSLENKLSTEDILKTPEDLRLLIEFHKENMFTRNFIYYALIQQEYNYTKTAQYLSEVAKPGCKFHSCQHPKI
ncbi:hypothetical protein Btru_048458 [Bulinus truncatus]|nr:hypothetical protein Btru_048458 [Bulinus truncatus]